MPLYSMQGTTADPGMVAYWFFPQRCSPTVKWLIVYVMLSRPRSLATLISIGLTDKVRNESRWCWVKRITVWCCRHKQLVLNSLSFILTRSVKLNLVMLNGLSMILKKVVLNGFRGAVSKKLELLMCMFQQSWEYQETKVLHCCLWSYQHFWNIHVGAKVSRWRRPASSTRRSQHAESHVQETAVLCNPRWPQRSEKKTWALKQQCWTEN